MSGILKNKKQAAVYAAGLLVLLAVMLLLKLPAPAVVIICILYAACVLLNEAVLARMVRMHKPFEPQSSIRNVDYLLIGDQIDPADCEYLPENASYVQVAAPDRGYHSAWQLLRHTHSILREEGGTVIFAAGKCKKRFLLFDMPYLHRITVTKYRLQKLRKMSRYPLIFAPVASIRLLLGTKALCKPGDPPQELVDFCKERDYDLIYLER